MVKTPHKSYLVELTVLYDNVVLGAIYKAGVANTYCDCINEEKAVHWRDKQIDINSLPLKELFICNSCWSVVVQFTGTQLHLRSGLGLGLRTN